MNGLRIEGLHAVEDYGVWGIDALGNRYPNREIVRHPRDTAVSTYGWKWHSCLQIPTGASQEVSAFLSGG